MICGEEPEQFTPRFEVVSCYVERDGMILLLHRNDEKSEGNTWGVPAGKVDPGETPVVAMLREIREETGLVMDPDAVEYLTRVFVRYPDYDFTYHMFRAVVSDDTEVTINPGEHKSFRWVTPTEALAMDLIRDLDACIKMYYPETSENSEEKKEAGMKNMLR